MLMAWVDNTIVRKLIGGGRTESARVSVRLRVSHGVVSSWHAFHLLCPAVKRHDLYLTCLPANWSIALGSLALHSAPGSSPPTISSISDNHDIVVVDIVVALATISPRATNSIVSSYVHCSQTSTSVRPARSAGIRTRRATTRAAVTGATR